MKTTLALTIVLMLTALFGAGCAALLQKKAPATSLPVLNGAATTNDLASVAWLQLAQDINKAVNPTSTSMPIDTGLGALIGLISAASGFLARHVTGPKNVPVARTGDKTG